VFFMFFSPVKPWENEIQVSEQLGVVHFAVCGLISWSEGEAADVC
jgi:hypothetical protein